MIGVWFSVDDDLLSISSNFRPLSNFIANQEYTLSLIGKEIGIRKVLGASALNVAGMLLWRFTKWVLVAIGIACPMASLAMSAWLRDFAFRINIGWTVFFMAGLIWEQAIIPMGKRPGHKLFRIGSAAMSMPLAFLGDVWN